MQITFWGVRGSIATSGPDVARTGGNTTCLEVEMAGRTLRTEVSITNGVLRLGAAGVSLPGVTLPVTGLLPCHPNATLADDRIKLACSFEKVPPRLIQLVNGASAHG